MKRWLKVTLEIDPALVESVSDFLVGVLDAGVEVVENGNADQHIVHVYLQGENPNERELLEQVERIRVHACSVAEIFRTNPPKVSWQTYDEEDWGKNWKKHFTPFTITPGLVIAPTWEKYFPKQNEKVLVMDPGMAFGTGHHATTALAMELVHDSLKRLGEPGRVLDVGTGTGVLGMAAVLWGAEEVFGIDNDPVAVTVAAENVSLNAFDHLMRVDITPLAEITGQYRLVIANIVHDVLIELADDLARVTADGGELILSGILAEGQPDSIRIVFEQKGLLMRDLRISGEWAAMLLLKSETIDFPTEK